ncbi:uncharacterized protein J3D65DRAFT_559080 [Phyllosticta citribraziliensis]|uniref:Uncharacterized protein n=1 Tax=Phyllosticta citribraziliensis TaxID=989973 RepID=A0ABR1L9L8_9PEZI
MKNFLSSKYSLERENRGQYLQPRISDREDDRGKSGQWSSKDGDGFDHVRRIIRGEILGSLDSFDNRSKVVLHLNWSPRKFLESQEYKESPGEALAAAITITGSGKSAQATTTEAYLTQFWPESGAQTLRALQDSIRLNNANLLRCVEQERGKHIHASKDNGMGVTVTVTGPLYFVADVGEQLAWIGSALQTSSFKRVTYYVPLLSDLGAEEIDMSFYVQREEKMQGEHAMQEGVCWQGLFRSPVVVQGFPHTQEGRLGLDIPLNMMAALIKACRVTEFDGRLFIKGFSAILFPTKLVDNCITWHLVYNEDGSYISYLDKRIEALQNEDARKIGLSDLAAAPKNVVGWCAKAENFTGRSLDAHYPVSRSACEEPRSGWIFEKLSLSGGQYINLGLSFCMGVKDKPLHLWYRPTYEQQVLRFSKKYVLLYDVDDRRGWLVNGTSALLHLVIASWKYELSTAIGDRFLSKIEDLKMVGEKTTADRAFAILIDRENMALPVLPGKRTTKVEESVVTFSDRVEEAIHYLEKAFTIQEEKMYSPGHEVTMPISTDTLPGYDFAEICESQTTVPCRFTELRATSKGWMAFLRKIQAVALFGREFGDLIRPTSAECSVWKDMPSGKDYIAVNVLDMKDLIDRKALSLEKFDWHCPERPFECSHDAAPCHRAQALVPKSSLSWLGSANNVCGPKILEGNERGAIILGGTGGLRPHRNSSQRRSS